MSNTKKNIGYNLIYRVVNVLVPLVTSPYISRTLSPEGIGKYGYTSSIASCCYLVAMLGVNSYGNREIAKAKDNKGILSETFWQIYYIQFFLSLFAVAIYLCFVETMRREYAVSGLITTMIVLSAIADINWFTCGMEEFKYISIRNIAMRIIMAVCYFLFIKSENDLWKYCVITCLFSNLLPAIVLWPMLNKYVTFMLPNWREITKHLKCSLLLFFPVVANALYQYMDKIMMGAWASSAEIGYYNYAEHILQAPMALTLAIGTVMLPKSSMLVNQNGTEENTQLIMKTVKYSTILNTGMCFGVIAIADVFIPFFLGNGYTRTANILSILSIYVILNGVSTSLGNQFLLPNSLDKYYTVSIALGALTNVGLNALLIPNHGAAGAAMATVVSYAVLVAIESLFVGSALPLKKMYLEQIPFLAFGAIMLLILSVLPRLTSPLVELIIKVLCGAVLYISMTLMWLVFVKKDEEVKGVVGQFIHAKAE